MFRLYQPGPAPAQGRLDDLARDVAQCSAVDVVRALPVDMSRMGVAELRGYVRARALRPARRHARTLATQAGLPAAVGEVLAIRALERTVQLVVRQLSTNATVVLRAAG